MSKAEGLKAIAALTILLANLRLEASLLSIKALTEPSEDTVREWRYKLDEMELVLQDLQEITGTE